MAEGIRLGALDHMHLVVPDREAAAQWYEDVLGFKRVQEYQHWWNIPGAPIHVSADGGSSGLALFQAGEGHELTNGIGMGVAFKLPGAEFVAFAKALGSRIQLNSKSGKPLTANAIVDLDLCYSYGFFDPYGHELELTTYDREQVTPFLAEAGISPIRYW